MAIERIKVRVSTPTGRLLPGRGFYQVDEDTLFVQLGRFQRSRHFYSYLESDSIRIDIDREGRPIFVEVGLPRRHWRILPNFRVPPTVESADIRFTDFRKTIRTPAVFTSPDRTAVLIRFDRSGRSSCYDVVESVVAEISDNDELCALWITGVVDDFAGRQLAAFRSRQSVAIPV